MQAAHPAYGSVTADLHALVEGSVTGSRVWGGFLAAERVAKVGLIMQEEIESFLSSRVEGTELCRCRDKALLRVQEAGLATTAPRRAAITFQGVEVLLDCGSEQQERPTANRRA